MKYCSGCGVQIEDDARFCGNCGDMFTQPDMVAQISAANQNPGLGLKFKIIAGTLLAVLLIIGGFLGWNNHSSQAQVDKKLELAVKYLNESRYKEAILAYNEAIKIDPKNIEARVGLARAYIGIGNYEQAEETVTAAAGIGSLSPEQYRVLIKAYIEQGRFEEAERLLTQAKEKYAANALLAGAERLLKEERSQAETRKNALLNEPPPIKAAQTTPVASPPRPVKINHYLDEDLIHAVGYNDMEKVKSLLAQGADPSAKESTGWSALHEAADRGRPEIAQVLIAAGANVNAQINLGETPLMFACRNGDTELVKVLLNAGADVNLKEYFGKRALNYARDKMGENSEMFKLLKQHGAIYGDF